MVSSRDSNSSRLPSSRRWRRRRASRGPCNYTMTRWFPLLLVLHSLLLCRLDKQRNLLLSILWKWHRSNFSSVNVHRCSYSNLGFRVTLIQGFQDLSSLVDFSLSILVHKFAFVLSNIYLVICSNFIMRDFCSLRKCWRSCLRYTSVSNMDCEKESGPKKFLNWDYY